jgi:hypothetical protein
VVYLVPRIIFKLLTGLWDNNTRPWDADMETWLIWLMTRKVKCLTYRSYYLIFHLMISKDIQNVYEDSKITVEGK